MNPKRANVAIVTGAGGAGCGRAISLRFARAAHAVVVADIDERSGRETADLVERAGAPARFEHVDVRDAGSVEQMIAAADRAFGGVDVLVNNASAPHGDASIDTWMDAIQTDFLGPMAATRAAIPVMRRGGGGAIVNIASISALWHGRTSPGGFAGYDVAKAAMIRMTTRLASLAETDQIRVTCLAPGWIGTDPVRQYWQSLTPAERIERGVPSRLLTTDGVADTVFALSQNRELAGRVVVWWSEGPPQLVEWGDRGYRHVEPFDVPAGVAV
jgi:NAD(P)-dependent dehydrogenase (short-subunit alcohol dehydrogenase family)